jgi:DNA polymerase-4
MPELDCRGRQNPGFKAARETGGHGGRVKTRTILHVDVDCFFASIERRENPLLKGKPIAVGGHSVKRGVVASASYEAKARGVSVCMPYWRARELCPEMILLPCDMEKYLRYSTDFHELLLEFSDLVEPIGMDEAFIDITPTIHFFGTGERAAQLARNRIDRNLGIPASVGIAENKTLAKVATRMAKPSGIYRLQKDAGVRLLQSLPVGTIDGIGHTRRRLLEQLGIRTVGELSALPLSLARKTLAGEARVILERSRGEDRRTVSRGRRAGISRELTFDRDQNDQVELENAFLALCTRLSCLLGEKRLVASTVTVRIRFSDFREIRRSSRLAAPTCSEIRIHAECTKLVSDQLQTGRRVRLIGVRVGELKRSEGCTQLDLIHGETGRVERAIGTIRDRFGARAIGLASALLVPADMQSPGNS